MKKSIGFLPGIILCFFCIFSYAKTKPSSLFIFDRHNYEVKTIQLSTGVKLQYVEQGDANGVPVILLHGITDSWHSFETVLPLLPKNIHVYVISQRGHGNSDRPDTGYDPKHFANDIADFIMQKNTGPVVIVGHSMGGVIAQRFALDYPALTSGLVIVSSATSFKNNPTVPGFYSEVQKQKRFDKTFMEAFQKSTIVKPVDEKHFNTLVNESVKVPAYVFKATLKSLVDFDYTSELKMIQKPVMILWGEKDNFCLRADQEIFVKEIKMSNLVVYEGTGHALHWEEPKRFSNDLLVFISSLDEVDKHKP